MRRVNWLGTSCLLMAGALGMAAPGSEGKPIKGVVDPLGQVSYVETLGGQKRASALVIGDGGTFMGLYVFDRWGNCVARDDYTETGSGRDDLAVEWYPPQDGLYSVEVCNFGRSSNNFTVVVR